VDCCCTADIRLLLDLGFRASEQLARLPDVWYSERRYRVQDGRRWLRQAQLRLHLWRYSYVDTRKLFCVFRYRHNVRSHRCVALRCVAAQRGMLRRFRRNMPKDAARRTASRARTSYYQPTYHIWSLYLRPLQRYEKEYKVWKMGWLGAVMGQPRSLKIAPFDRAHTSYY